MLLGGGRPLGSLGINLPGVTGGDEYISEAPAMESEQASGELLAHLLTVPVLWQGAKDQLIKLED